MKLDKLTPTIIGDARTSWIARAEALDMPLLDYETTLERAAKNINYENGAQAGLAYGLFDDDGSMLAVVDIVYTKKTGVDLGWLKWLDIKFSPDFSAAEIESDLGKYQKIIDIYCFSISQVVALTASHPARVVKIYGRDQEFLKLLVSIKKFFEIKESQNFTLEMHGRWLVISEK